MRHKSNPKLTTGMTYRRARSAMAGCVFIALMLPGGALATPVFAAPPSEESLQSAMDALISVDEDQKIILFNQAAERMFRWSAGELVGRSMDCLIPERFRRTHGEHIRRFGQSGVTTRKMGALGMITGLRAGGEEFPIEASISQVGVEGKRYFTVILRDITERRRLENELAERE